MSKVHEFADSIDSFSFMDKSVQIDHFAYFLTKNDVQKSFTAKQIQNCFTELSLREHPRLAAYLSENAGSKDGKYVKKEVGYRLEKKAFDAIGQILENEPQKVRISQTLTDLTASVKDSNEKSYLIEAINCLKINANRAAIMLMWILSLSHLQNHIYSYRLVDFNDAIAKQSDKKMKPIVDRDDFSDIKETKFIELCRSANIISNSVRKILDEKLGTRNSSAHPSGVTTTSHKATEFILDLTENILLKY